MNHIQQPSREGISKKTFEAPTLRREARLPIITAGSFDLLIPGGSGTP